MFENNKDFYPTPNKLINKLIEGIDFRNIKTMLEPSCGKGNIIDYIIENKIPIDKWSGKKQFTFDIDCIEIDQNLRYILQGKGYRVIYDDFLKYNTLKNYDLIVANFPFSEGDKHLLKALNMLQQSGGELRCIINAETIKNPYSNIRKEVVQILEQNNASIEYLQNEFANAERKTNVEIALIKCNINKVKTDSIIINTLKEVKEENENEYSSNYIVDNDFLKAIITRYNFECKVGIKLIDEYKKLESFTKSSFDEDTTILTLKLNDTKYNDREYDNILKNDYLKKVRYKYWKALFNNKEFTKLFTSNILKDFYNKLNDLSNYEFNEFNINELKNQLNNQIGNGIKETILNLFDEFSDKHHYYDENGKNIHYYNGWKTNSCWKINKRVIIPLNGYGMWNEEFHPTYYNCINKLSDIEKVFNYLDTGKTEELTLREILKEVEDNKQTKGVITKFFKIDFYKKGTAHLTFLDKELLDKFNRFGAEEKGWLPPSYGKKSYEDMSKEEQEVIDEFEGKNTYDKVIKNTNKYIYNTNNMLLLK